MCNITKLLDKDPWFLLHFINLTLFMVFSDHFFNRVLKIVKLIFWKTICLLSSFAIKDSLLAFILLLSIENKSLSGFRAFFSTMAIFLPTVEVIASKLACHLIYFISITLCEKSGREKDPIFLDLFRWTSIWS